MVDAIISAQERKLENGTDFLEIEHDGKGGIRGRVAGRFAIIIVVMALTAITLASLYYR